MSDVDVALKTARGILNKLTPEKFEKLYDQFMEMKVSSVEILSAVVSIVYDKAVYEYEFASMYADFCARLCCVLKGVGDGDSKAVPLCLRPSYTSGF